MPAPKDVKSLLQKVKRLQIQSRKAVAGFMAGQYRSAFEGKGIEFDEVRDFRSGDDPARIDWNVTARFGTLFVKTFVEERDRDLILVVDSSASLAFGSTEMRKWDTVVELAALLGFSALANDDKVGMILFSKAVEFYLPPKRGTTQGLRLVRELLAREPIGRGTSIAAALSFLARVRHRRAIVLLLSDFLDDGFERPVRVAAARHDLVALRVHDRREERLEGGGIVRVRDLETGRERDLDLDDRLAREAFARSAKARGQRLRQTFLGLGVDFLDLSAGPLDFSRIRRFFRKRVERRIPG